MTVNDIVIPSTTTPIVIKDRDVDGGIDTSEGNIATPLLQGGSSHVNPCMIGDVEGTLAWTGSNYADMTGDWTFTRNVGGSEVVIDRPTAIRTSLDINHNSPHLMVIYIGQNGGYDDIADLIRQHKLMIQHAHAKNYIVLGMSSGSAATRADYETAMRNEFGRYFISLREYLSQYGMDDANLTPTQDDLEAMALGITPSSLLADSVHYTSACKTVVGEMLFRKCRDLNIL